MKHKTIACVAQPLIIKRKEREREREREREMEEGMPSLFFNILLNTHAWLSIAELHGGRGDRGRGREREREQVAFFISKI